MRMCTGTRFIFIVLGDGTDFIMLLLAPHTILHGSV